MNENEAKKLLISYLEALPFNREEDIYNYLIPKGINMSDHTLLGTRLPEGFTGFFYSTHQRGERWQNHPTWIGYVEDGKGIFFISLMTWRRVVNQGNRSGLQQSIEFQTWGGNPCAWAVYSFYDITHLIIDYPSKFINWRTNPFEVSK